MQKIQSVLLVLVMGLSASSAFAKGGDPTAQESLSVVVTAGKHCGTVVAAEVIEASLKASTTLDVVSRVGNQSGKKFQVNLQDIGLTVQALTKAEIKQIKAMPYTRITKPKDYLKYSFCVDLSQAEFIKDSLLNDNTVGITLKATDDNYLMVNANDPAVAGAALTIERATKVVAPPIFTAKVLDRDSGAPAPGFTVQLLAQTRSSPTTFNSQIIVFRGITDVNGIAVLVPYGVARYQQYFLGFDDGDFTQIFTQTESQAYTWLPAEIYSVYRAEAICGYYVGKTKTQGCSNSSTGFNYDPVDTQVLYQEAGKVIDYTGRLPLTVSL